MTETVLVRYGAIPVVARCRAECEEHLSRGLRVIVTTSRGLELGTVLESLNGNNMPAAVDVDGAPQFSVLRPASSDDERQVAALQTDCQNQFADWQRRIEGWALDLELIDLEWTLDRSRLVLYVLNERGPDCTKLALQAAAAGLGPIEVQPVDAEGLMQPEAAGGGCGSGGCGCSH